MYKIDRVDPAPLYEQIRQILIREIRSGRYSEGDRLPTAYELCRQFTVSVPQIYLMCPED